MTLEGCPNEKLLCSLVIQETGTGSEPQVVWANPQRWMKASIGLLGKEGEMMAMTPSIAAYTPSRQLEWEYLDEGRLFPIAYSSSE